MEIQILSEVSQQSQNNTFDGFPKINCFKRDIFENDVKSITPSDTFGFKFIRNHILFEQNSENVCF